MELEVLLIASLHAAIIAATPILYAALGEIFAERSGVLNLGVEGIMLVGAASGFYIVVNSQSLTLGILTAIIASLLLGLLFSYLTITLKANQVVTGFVLTIFGMGLSGFIGKSMVGIASPVVFKPVPIPLLSKIPVLGEVFFNHDVLVYFLYLLTPLAWIFIYRTKAGLELRAVGENPGAADALGISVARIRYFYVCLGAVLGGVAGAYISLAYAPSWLENMVGGRGWIGIVLVIFATWNPARAAIGALLFGGADVIGFRLQAMGIEISPQFMRMAPYLLTIVVLAIITARAKNAKNPMPKALALPYDREDR